MPVVTPSNSYLGGIAKQTNEATQPANPSHSFPVFSSDLGPRYDVARVEVTDAASIEGDAFKRPTYWQGTLELPCFAESLGVFLQSMWPTDTKTGAGPFTHTFSGLGGTQSWISLFAEWPGAGAFEQRFSRGLASSITFSATQEGGPMRMGFEAFGQVPEVLAYTPTLADDLSDGWFQFQIASATIEGDFDTPDVNPSVALAGVRDFSLTVARPVTPEPTVDGTTVTNLAQGKVANTGTLTFLYSSWDAYRASYFGAVAGSAVSATMVYGAFAAKAIHTLTSTWSLEIYIPKVQYHVNVPTPNPAGDALVHSVEFRIAKPAAGDHVQPILINAQTLAY